MLRRPQRPGEQGCARSLCLLTSVLTHRAAGFTTFGSLPTKFIGGAAAISGWGSAECGSCWTLTYNGKSINVLAIDHTDAGFNIALSAMNALTNNQGVFLGRVNAQASPADPSACGL